MGRLHGSLRSAKALCGPRHLGWLTAAIGAGDPCLRVISSAPGHRLNSDPCDVAGVVSGENGDGALVGLDCADYEKRITVARRCRLSPAMCAGRARSGSSCTANRIITMSCSSVGRHRLNLRTRSVHLFRRRWWAGLSPLLLISSRPWTRLLSSTSWNIACGG